MGSPPTLDPVQARGDIPCLLCGTRNLQTLHEKPPFRIVRCRDCSLVYTLPRLPAEALAEMYQEAYWRSSSAKDFGYTDYLADAELYVKTFRMRSALVKKYRPPPATLLDVGCAAGFALEAFRAEGYDVHGVELSASMAAEAGRRVGADRVHAGTLTPELFGNRRFGVVTLWDVLEHLEEPIELLAIVRDRLEPTGILVLETQNVTSLFARLMGVRWQHYKFEEHLYHFSPRTIRTVLQRAGLELVEWSPRRGGKYVSLNFLVERAHRVHPLFATLLRPLKVLGNPCFYVNVFDEMLVVARPCRSAESS